MAERFGIDFADEAKTDLRNLRAFDRQQIVHAIEDHLQFSPKMESRSRVKRMTEPFWSQYRLRVSEFRVYYNVDDERNVVSVLRVLSKHSGQTPGEPP